MNFILIHLTMHLSHPQQINQINEVTVTHNIETNKSSNKKQQQCGIHKANGNKAPHNFFE